MRGLKAKTVRRVARSSGLPAETKYGVKYHRVLVINPFYPEKPGEPPFIEVRRAQLVLVRGCQRAFVQRMKRHRIERGSFFGVAVRDFRSGRANPRALLQNLQERK